jgi:hypothetical protein
MTPVHCSAPMKAQTTMTAIKALVITLPNMIGISSQILPGLNTRWGR